MSTIPEAITSAVEHHQAGRLAMAEQIYRQILAVDPNHVDALHLLGVVLHQIDKRDEAAGYIQQAILLNDRIATFHNSLGNVHKAHQRYEEAMDAYRRAIELMPNYAEAYNNLGNTLKAMGRLEEAVDTYFRAQEAQPNYADAYSNQGGALKQLGRLDEAIIAFQRALEIDPRLGGSHNNLGNVYKDQGKLDEAIACYRRALELKPDYAEGYNSLASALHDAGELDDAVAAYRRALELRPNYPEVLNNLGNTWKAKQNVDEAIVCLRQALQLKPDFAEAHNNLGTALMDQKNFEEAIVCFRQALVAKPAFPEAHNNLGAALKEQGALTEAEASCREALNLKPDFAAAYTNLGGVLRDQGKFAAALECFYLALRHHPEDAGTHYQLGNALRDQGKLDESIAEFQRAIEIKPDFAEAHANLGLAWLITENWPAAWSEYEWRWRITEMPPRDFPQPLWQGEALAGKTILFHAEQGLGDAIQYIRFAPILKAQGATVVVECQPPLTKLFARCAGVDQLIGRGTTPPPFDVHIPFMSVSGILNNSLDTIPVDVPYIHIPPMLIEQWQERLAKLGGFRIGINWQGNSKFLWDRFRSFPLKYFASLSQVPGVRLISLQKGRGTEQLAEVREQFCVMDLEPELDQQAGPFMDTAAVMRNMDLVITSDTATAHLAGALGVPVWVALNFMPDWRWLLNRSDSPWYPTMRLFRQKEPGAWNGVFEEIKRALCERLSK